MKVQSEVEHPRIPGAESEPLQRADEPESKIKQYKEFVPDLATANHPEIAKKLVDAIEQARRELEEYLELTSRKLAFLGTVEARMRVVNANAETEDIDFSSRISQVSALTEIYESPNTFEDLLTKIQTPGLAEFVGEAEWMGIYKKELHPVRKLTALVWKRAEHEQQLRRAESSSKRFVKECILKIVRSVEEDAEAMMPESNLRLLYHEYSSAKPADIDTAEMSLVDGVGDLLQGEENLKRLEQAIIFLKELQENHEEDFGYEVGRINTKVNQLKEFLTGSRSTWEDNVSSSAPVKTLASEILSLTNTVQKLFGFRRSPSIPTREDWSITKELLDAITELNNRIEQAHKKIGADVKDYQVSCYFAQIQEAKKISSGRLLVHSAPTAVIRQILTRGDLSSISEQDKRHGQKQRTHEGGTIDSQGEDVETHDITFEVDQIYRNFSDDDEETTRRSSVKKTDVALVFSENHLLENRQYFDIDGVHVFDENYGGDRPDAPGLSIDLLSTPFMMVVSEKERDKFIKFLTEQSVFKDILSSFGQDQLDDWIESHILFTSSLHQFQCTPQVKERFFSATKLKPRKGYIEETDAEAHFKASYEKTRRFVPTSD